MNNTDNYRKLWIFWLGIIFLLVILKRMNVYTNDDMGIVISGYLLLCFGFLAIAWIKKMHKIKMKLINLGKMEEWNLNPVEPLAFNLTTIPFLFSDESFGDEELFFHKTSLQILFFYACVYFVTTPFVVIMIYFI